MANGPILVVDGDRELRALVAEALRLHGYDVEEAEDGVRALGAVLWRTPALLVLDYHLPRLGCVEVGRVLREHGLRIPILLITASERPERARDQVGADACLGKPFDLEQLLAEVERLAGPPEVSSSAEPRRLARRVRASGP